MIVVESVHGPAPWTIKQFGRLSLDNPDVPKLDGIAVVLEEQTVGFWSFGVATWCAVGEFHIIVNHEAVVANRNSSVFDLRITIIFRGGEIDVVGLPRHRRKASVEIGLGDLIDASALIVTPNESKGVENLDFISALHIHAAVGSALSPRVRHEGSAKL